MATVWNPGNSSEMLRNAISQHLQFWLSSAMYKSRVPKTRITFANQGDRQTTGLYVVVATRPENHVLQSFNVRQPNGTDRPAMEEGHSISIYVKADMRNKGLEYVEPLAALIKSILMCPKGTEEYTNLVSRGLGNVTVADMGMEVDPDVTGGRGQNAHTINDNEGIFFTECLSMHCTTDIYCR